jgi:hypothetical protein
MQIQVNSPGLKKFIQGLEMAPRKIYQNNVKWIQRMTKFTWLKMKRYAISTNRKSSKRGTGKLSNNIFQQLSLGLMALKGRVYVDPKINYQWAAEYGFKTKKFRAIKARSGYLTFHYSNWQRAAGNVRLQKMANANGYYFFKAVSRGTYPGMYFALKSYISLAEYYNANRAKIANDIAQAITLSTNV